MHIEKLTQRPKEQVKVQTVPPLVQGFLGEGQIRDFLQKGLDGLVD